MSHLCTGRYWPVRGHCSELWLLTNWALMWDLDCSVTLSHWQMEALEYQPTTLGEDCKASEGKPADRSRTLGMEGKRTFFSTTHNDTENFYKLGKFSL